MTDKQVFDLLGWALIEWKIMHFHGSKVHKSWHKVLTIDDPTYDQAENLYLQLAKQLGERPVTTEAVTVDANRGSVSMALEKLSQPAGTNKPVLKRADILSILSQYPIAS